jgi:hypothetical protein
MADAEELFARATHALSDCEDVAVVGGSRAARAYLSGAGGAVRHAFAILVAERQAPAHRTPEAGFEIRRVGTSEVVGGRDGWDTVLRCRLPDGSHATVRALWQVGDHLDGVWMRPDGALPGLWTRGRLEEVGGGLCFRDEPERDRSPVPMRARDLGRDLVALGIRDVSSRPAFAAALEVTLASGSWCHLATGSRWFADDAAARAIVRMLGGGLPSTSASFARLRGVIDRAALMEIERAGWRHVPTPSI